MKTGKFIQLGEKKNGRIVKNEQYSFVQFEELVDEAVLSDMRNEIPKLRRQIKLISISWLDIVFKTRKYKKALSLAEQLEETLVRTHVSIWAIHKIMWALSDKIEFDVEGKGSGKAKKSTKKKTVKGKKYSMNAKHSKKE